MERFLVTALLLLLLALAPAMAQDVVYTGETTTLSVRQEGADTYQWELYSNPTVNFAKVPGDPSPTAYAEFAGPNDGATVQVKWKKPGTYYFKVTALDAAGCAINFKIGMIEVRPVVPNRPPFASDDHFPIDCNSPSYNVLKNDTIPGNDVNLIRLSVEQPPIHGALTLNPDGTFKYQVSSSFTGGDFFVYALDKNKYPGAIATVYLTIIADFDFDGIPDDLDIDADGDGILNDREAPGKDWHTADADNDGLPNYMDIDADGDGIVDNYEGQGSKTYKKVVIYDANNNGLNDAYDGRQSGYEIDPVDSDEDGIPDFLDADSDNDGVPDPIEGHDKDFNGIADHVLVGTDADKDGLDDAFDTVFNACDAVYTNMTGSNAAMQNFDKDGLPDWRDDNDDNDKYLTNVEDLNGNGNFSDDDYDFDGRPEYLDYGRDCDVFIPDAFSPNGDGIHDYFEIFCIDQYPNAKIYIFDQLGNMLFQKANYGNKDIWTKDEAAPWWDGRLNRGRKQGERVAPGTYYSVLDLGNGEVKKSFVFVSY